MLLGLYFTMVIALPALLGTYVLWRGMPRTRRCPACASETFLLRSSSHAFASRVLKREVVQRRWCMGCGWQGTVRLRPDLAPAFAPVGSPAPATPDLEWMDLRTLTLDGHAWRVKLECWCEAGVWRARLVFVAPGGRTWLDQGSIEGGSAGEVIGRALRLPERTLAGRLRRATR